MTNNFIQRFLGCAALVFAGYGWGQAPASSHLRASISGSVLDPSDALIAGASVTLGSGNRDLFQTKTDDQGEFRFSTIAPGHYELRIGHPGFKTYQTRVNVGAGGPAPFRVVLEIADLEETMRVESPGGVVNTEPSENVDILRLDPRQLEYLPILDRDAISAISRFLDPAATGEGGPTVIVDGLPSSETNLPLSEIEDVKINNNPYSAEYARPGRGRIEIVTKSGSSKYHGSIYLGFRDYRMDARNAFAIERPPERRRRLEANLTGPIHKGKKNTFSLTFSHNQDNLEPTVYAENLSGPIRENASQSQTSTYFSGQFTRRVDKNNALSLRYTDFDWSFKGQGEGQFGLPGSGYDLATRYHQLFSSYRTVVSPRMLNELMVRVRAEDNTARSRLTGVSQVQVLNAFTTGGAQIESNGTDDRLEFSDVLSWSVGRNLLKTGVNIPVLGRLGSNDRSYANGVFYFASLDDYAARAPFLFLQQAGDGHLSYWQRQVSGFVQDEIKLRSNLSLSLGLRYDWQQYVGDNNNFAPRFSFAYAPSKSRKTVFRGGAGIFHDVMPASAITNLLRFQSDRYRRIQIENPNYPNPFLGPLNEQPPDLVRFDPTLRMPYIIQYSFAVEHQLKKSRTLTVGYTETRGVNLFRSRDLNAPLPPLYDSRPDPSIGVLRQIESSGGLKSHGLDVTLRGNVSRFFTGSVVYKWRHATNDTDGIMAFPSNNWNLRGEWGRASFDEAHFVYLYGTLSVGKLFKLGTIFSANSGRPYTLTTGRDEYNDGTANDRPRGVPRNSLQATGASSLDLRWSREFALLPEGKERLRLLAAVDAFNLFNRVNYIWFIGDQSSPFFGTPTGADWGRRMQASITLKF